MIIIEKLTELIDEEICDAKNYAKLALEYKETYPDAAAIFNTLSLDEIRHMNSLHGVVTKIIGDIPAEEDTRTMAMKMAYDILHRKAIEETKEVIILQNMYR